MCHIEDPYKIQVSRSFNSISAFLEENGMTKVFCSGDRHVDYCLNLGNDYFHAELNKVNGGYSLVFDKRFLDGALQGDGRLMKYVSMLEEKLDHELADAS